MDRKNGFTNKSHYLSYVEDTPRVKKNPNLTTERGALGVEND